MLQLPGKPPVSDSEKIVLPRQIAPVKRNRILLPYLREKFAINKELKYNKISNSSLLVEDSINGNQNLLIPLKETAAIL